MMTTTYSTGRDYGKKQVLKIDYIPFEGSDFDDDAFDCVAVRMNDEARGLDYMLRVLRMECNEREIGAAVLRSYDNHHQAPWNSKVGDTVQI